VGDNKDNSGLPNFGFKEFVQLSGFGIAVGLLSMYSTQNVLVERLEAYQDKAATEVSNNREYFDYVLRSISSRHNEQYDELRRKLDEIERKLTAITFKNSIGDR